MQDTKYLIAPPKKLPIPTIISDLIITIFSIFYAAKLMLFSDIIKKNLRFSQNNGAGFTSNPCHHKNKTYFTSKLELIN